MKHTGWRVAALGSLLIASGGCSYLSSERMRVEEVPGRTGELTVVVLEWPPSGGGHGTLFAFAYRPVEVPSGSECEIVEAGSRSVIHWDAGDKLLSLPIGLGLVAATPLAIPVGLSLSLAGERVADFDALSLPLLVLMGGVSRLVAFCWFPQALPADSFEQKAVDEPVPPRVRRAALPAGRWSLSATGVMVTARVGGVEVPFGQPTNEGGWTRAGAGPPGPALAGRTIEVDLRAPGAAPERRTVVVGAFPYDLPEGVPARLTIDAEGRIVPEPVEVTDLWLPWRRPEN